MEHMNELIAINYENDKPTVNGRDLHAALQVKTAYKDWFPRMCEYGFIEGKDFSWFPRMCEYGFIEGKDFSSFLSESTGGRPGTDHQLSIGMAKQLCMLQRSEVGRKFREYFIGV